MLTTLCLNNFKSWREIRDMRLAPITGLFGTNSSGKTSLLQLLLLLKQTADSPDRAQVLNLGDDRSLVSLGTFSDVIIHHSPTESLSWRLEWELVKELRVADPEQKLGALFADRTLRFEARVAGNGSGQMAVSRMAYGFASHQFGMERSGGSEGGYKLFADAGAFKFRRSQGRAWSLPPPVRCYGFPDQVRAYFQNAGFLSDFELAFEELFSRLYYLGPLREYPRREYVWAGAQPLDVGRRGERVVEALLGARERGMFVSRGKGKPRLTVEAYVAWWLRELGLISEFAVEPITEGSNLYQVWVRKDASGPRVRLTDVGFGVSQILPVLALCYTVPEGSTIILEQPEIHLHPSVQAGLADVFIDAVKKRHVQIILESHSEHLLMRLQRRIAEERFAADQTALYFCHVEEGESRLTPLDMDPFGAIRNWPTDFFGNPFEEVAQMTRAGIHRRQEQAG